MSIQMLIKKIQFDNLTFAAAAGLHRAVIILTTDRSTLSLLGRAELPEAASRNDVALELMRDALRQIRQMPEFRRQGEKVQVAKDATQEFLRSA